MSDNKNRNSPLTSDWSVLTPALLMAAVGLSALVYDLFRPRGRDARSGLDALAGVGLAAAGLLLFAMLNRALDNPAPGRVVFGGALIRDAFGTFIETLVWAATGLTVLVGGRMRARDGVPAGEFYGLLFLGSSGMMLLAISHDLMMIFLALETLSLAVYALTALPRGSARAGEAGMKYFVLGAFASAFLLYGMAMAYGASGSLALTQIAVRSFGPAGFPNLARLGLGLMCVGLAFKIGAVPFHAWVPDVYEGATAPVAGFMSAAVKVSAFAVLVRVAFTAFPLLAGEWNSLLYLLAVLTLVVGNLAALAQTNLKRLLAYSSIAHTGYALVGLVSANGRASGEGAASTGFYLLVYTAMTLGAFGILALTGRGGGDLETLEDCAGLARRRPATAAALALFLISLAGIPPTAGFLSKFYVFRAALHNGYIGLTVIGVIGALVSVYYYLLPVVAMYMAAPRGSGADAQADQDKPRDGVEEEDFGGALISALGIGLAALAVIVIGVFPSATLEAVSAIMRGLPGTG